MIFSKMRRQKYFFDFRFEISVKFRVDWCIRLYDSYLICQYSLYFIHIHAYANMNSRENVGKFQVNHIVLYINRREISRWFRIWSQKNIFAYAFSRKSRFKKFAWADSKILNFFESVVKFWLKIYPLFYWSYITSSRTENVLKIENAS